MKTLDLIMYYGFGLGAVLNFIVAIWLKRWESACLGVILSILAWVAWLDYKDERDRDDRYEGKV